MGQVTGQLEELKSTVDDISSKVRRHDTILRSRGATGSRVRDRSFESAELRSRRGPSACCRSVAEVAAPSKRGPSAFILAPLIETELSLPSVSYTHLTLPTKRIV